MDLNRFLSLNSNLVIIFIFGIFGTEDSSLDAQNDILELKDSSLRLRMTSWSLRILRCAQNDIFFIIFV
jgi:hypothetical protein